MPFRLLYLDDSVSDASIVQLALENAGSQINVSLRHVQTWQDFLLALENESFDLILSIDRVPGSSGDDALRVAQEKSPGTPFIIVTSEPGEERAIETLKRGAADYVLKERISRLVPAITRALMVSDSRRRRQAADAEGQRAQREAGEEVGERLKQLNQDLTLQNFELEVERLKWRNLVQGIADEVWTCDFKGHTSLLDLTPRGKTEAAEVKGAELARLLEDYEVLRPDGSVRPEEESPLRRSLKGEVVRGEEIVHNRRTGVTRIRQHSSVPVRDAGGQIIGAAAIVRDITEERKAESRIRQLNEELEARVEERTAALEQANKELEAFSYTVSHDLKAPLRAIEGFTRMLTGTQRALEPEKRMYYLELIRVSTEQMARLIESLLTFARASRQVPQKVRVDMVQLAEQVVQEHRQILGESQSHTRVSIGAMPREAEGDPVLLKQVFANLASNAFKFTRKREDPWIEIGGYRKGEQLVYYVRDNGAGFPSEKARDLFQVFQRLHSAADFEGTGVGLANVRKIIERHGGQVSAEGEEGKGATFYFTLPAAGGWERSPVDPQRSV